MKKILLCYAAITLFVASTALAKNEPSRMTYSMAMKAMNAAEAYTRQKNWDVTILITDQNAHPVLLHRLDGAFIGSLDYATGKALVVTQTGLTSGEYAAKLKAGDIAKIDGGVTYKGGVPVYVNGVLMGAVTVSGVKDFEDEEVAIAGAETIGSISKD